MARFFINVGAMDGMDTNQLLRFICETTNLDRSNIGRIDVKNSFSFFEVDSQLGDMLVPAFKDASYRNRSVRVEVSAGNGGGGEREGGRSSYGGDRSPSRSYGGDRGGRSYGGDRSGSRSYGGDRDGNRSYGGDREGNRNNHAPARTFKKDFEKTSAPVRKQESEAVVEAKDNKKMWEGLLEEENKGERKKKFKKKI